MPASCWAFYFRFADEEGRRLGERVASWTFKSYLRPVHRNKW